MENNKVTHSTFDLQQLCAELKRRREEKQISVYRLAELAGCSWNYIAELEQGKLKSVTTAKLGAVAAALSFELRFYAHPLPPRPETA